MRVVVRWLMLAVYVLAAARVTRLVTKDELTRPFREWWARTFSDYWAVLPLCSWCTGFWVSVVAVGVWWWAGDTWWLLLPATAFAVAYVVGVLAQRAETD